MLSTHEKKKKKILRKITGIQLKQCTRIKGNKNK